MNPWIIPIRPYSLVLVVTNFEPNLFPRPVLLFPLLMLITNSDVLTVFSLPSGYPVETRKRPKIFTARH